MPRVDALDPCVPSAEAASLALGEGSLLLSANATHLLAAFDLPREGYAALAVESGSASRTLLLMREHVVLRHAMAARVPAAGGGEWRAGELGIALPQDGPVAAGHGAMVHEVSEIQLYHAEVPPAAATCERGEPGHFALLLARASLAPLDAEGALVHVVALHDPLMTWLPRPLEGTTSIAQANLYLAREGEDAAQVRRALAHEPVGADLVPPLLALGGLAFVGLRGRR